MEIFNLVLRTILSQVEHYERNSWDWPKELSKACCAFADDQLVKIERCLIVAIGEIQEILKNRKENCVDTGEVGR